MKLPLELKSKYLARRFNDLHTLKYSLKGPDFTLARMIGHKVKGNASTFEFPQLTWIGNELEQAALREDKEKINKLIQEFEALLLTLRS